MSEESLAVVQSGKPSFSLAPRDLDQALKFADIMAKSSIIPKDFAGNPGNILVAVQWGMELGLQPMQAMQNIAVINGRPSLWGDAVIGLVRSSPLCEYVIEEQTENQSICRVKRRGEQEQVRIFTDDDAKKAGLLGKQGPWTQYPKRMRQMRARSWALRDVFPDVLRGMPIAEEVMDMPEKDITPPRQQPAAIEGKPAYPQEAFDTNLPKWSALIKSGKKTADEIIVTVASKATLTDAQKAAIHEAAKKPEEKTGAPADKASPALIEKLKDMAADISVPLSEVCDHIGVSSLDGITVEQAEKALKFLNGDN
ncbi:MAG: hypothetical protein H6R01_467 [Burkholderiaceae bacterium]|nr:hypothetical protein [Burkholderiaceae bacterium]